jgi:hypothetical protein
MLNEYFYYKNEQKDGSKVGSNNAKNGKEKDLYSLVGFN